MKRRIIQLIITEDMIIPTEGDSVPLERCSQVAYRFKFEDKEYGSYTVIDSPQLSENQVLGAATEMLMSALEAYEYLELQSKTG